MLGCQSNTFEYTNKSRFDLPSLKFPRCPFTISFWNCKRSIFFRVQKICNKCWHWLEIWHLFHNWQCYYIRLKPSIKIPVCKIIICDHHKETEENLLPELNAPKLWFVLCHELISQINSSHPFVLFVYYLRCLTTFPLEFV